MTNGVHDFATCQPVLEVRNVEEAIEWYRRVLDFDLEFAVGDPPEYACVGRGGLSDGACASVRFTGWLRDRDVVVNSGWLQIYVAGDIDALHDEIRARGAEISQPLGDRPWGMREFEIRDLNGHHLRFGRTIE